LFKTLENRTEVRLNCAIAPNLSCMHSDCKDKEPLLQIFKGGRFWPFCYQFKTWNPET